MVGLGSTSASDAPDHETWRLAVAFGLNFHWAVGINEKFMRAAVFVTRSIALVAATTVCRVWSDRYSSNLSKESHMRVFRRSLVGSALMLCVGLSFGPACAQDLGPLQSPKFRAANASPILNAPYARTENIAFLILKARRGGAVSATCSATACKDDSDCGSGCECNDDSVCAPSDE